MKRPVICFALALIAGIICSLFFSWTIILLIGIVYLYILIYSYYKIYFKYLIVLFIMFLIGLTNTNIIANSIETIVEAYGDQEVELLVKVLSIEESGEMLKSSCRIIQIEESSRKFFQPKHKILVSYKDEDSIEIGDKIKVRGKLKSISKPTNEGGFNTYNYYYARGMHFKIYGKKLEQFKKSNFNMNRTIWTIKCSVEKKIESIFKGHDQQIIKTMLLGIKKDLSDETKSNYKLAGISHLLAISGLHVSIISLGFIAFINKISKKPKVNIVVVITVLWCYCIMTGLSVSTVRATLMITIMYMGKLLYKNYDSCSAVWTSGIIVLLLNPYQLMDVGFLLSFGAVFGIILVSPKLNDQFNKNNIEIVSLLLATLAASLTTFPIVAYFFYQVPVYALLANVLILPFVSLVLYSSIVAIIVGYVNLLMGQLIGSLSIFILKYYEMIAKGIEMLPGNLYTIGKPNVWMIVWYYSIMFLVFKKNKNKVLEILESCLVVVFIGYFLVFAFEEVNELRITCLDVGQGDGAVIEYNHQVYLIDGGGEINNPSSKNVGAYVVYPYLLSQGYKKIDGIFISHSDFDHIYGIIEIINWIDIGFIVLPEPYKEYQDELTLMLMELAKEKELPVYYFKKGDSYTYNELEIECLFPRHDYMKFENNNNRSNVLKVSFKDFTMLFTGDIEVESEEKMIADGVELEADVLKVPHHGSGTSSTKDLLIEVAPTLAIFSYGENNFFGHPSYEVVERYRDFNIHDLHIAEEGAIQILVKDNKYRVSGFLSNRKEKYKCKN